MSNMKLIYRPEIDGLRAIAILSVVIYHAKISLNNQIILTGGYLGVDIFFVISGFLITSIVLKELRNNNTISLSYFYERRARRILPALFFVIIASYPFTLINLLPIELLDYSKSILSALGFSSNFYFHYTGIEYGGTSSLLKPFLHTWSLGVEEQYYLIFPIFMLFIFKYLKEKLIFILILLGIASLILSQWAAQHHSSINFYILPTRIWEILIGSLLAYVGIHKINFFYKVNNFFKEIILLIGLLLIVFSFHYFDSSTLHPSIITLVPVLGVSLIIIYGNQDLFFSKIISSKPIKYIGLISYSLYLWHYPIFSFARLNNIFQEEYKIFYILLSILLATFSYYFIEKKFRDIKKINFKNFFYYFIFSLVLIIFLNTAITSYRIKKFPTDLIKFDYRPWQKLRNNSNIICHNNPNLCYFNKNKNYKNIYFVGDSHASVLMHDFKYRFTDNSKFNLITMTTGCFGIPNFEFKKNNKKINDICTSAFYKKIENQIMSTKGNIIIISARFPMYLSDGKYFDNEEGGIEREGESFYSLEHNEKKISVGTGYKNFINNILNSSNKVILLYPIPEVGFNVPKKIFNSMRNQKYKDMKNVLNKNDFSTSYEVYKKRTQKTFDLFDSIDHKNLIKIFPHKVFCNVSTSRCITHSNDKIFYSDNNHLSHSAAKMVNNLIIDNIE